ncbi:MAG: DUF2254 family protein [Eubacteriales bacterium]|nr:DUF2254 family protein [Eubacteriales bacterium]
MDKFKLFISRSKSSLAFWRNILIAIFLTLMVVLIDYYGVFASYIPDFFLTKIDVARSILSSLGGTYLTITTFTFSTILTVLSTYSSNYSPRVIENFLSNDITMKVLGMFVGGFFYSIVSLFFMKSTDSEAMVIASTVIVFYSVMAIGNFVLFIFSVSKSLQESELIKDVVGDSNQVITRCIKDYSGKVRLSSVNTDRYQESLSLRFKDNGYLELISTKELLQEFKGQDAMLMLLPIEGDFLSENEVIARYLYNGELTDEEKEEISAAINRNLHVGTEKVIENDYRFSIEKLTEIALRAVSPGINDPNTAVDCLRYMGVLVGRLASVAESFTLLEANAEGEACAAEDYGVDSGNFKLVYPDFQLGEDLHYFYAPIVHYGGSDLTVVLAIFASLASARRVAAEDNRKIIDNFASYALEHVAENFTHPEDRIKLAFSFSPFSLASEEGKAALGEKIWTQAQNYDRQLGYASRRQNLSEKIEGAAEADASASAEQDESEA